MSDFMLAPAATCASASLARPRLMPCFHSEPCEGLMHPLGMAFDVGESHASHLCNGHALWTARPEVRRRTSAQVTQPCDDARAIASLGVVERSIVGYESLASRHQVVCAEDVALCLRIVRQESGG